MHLWTASKSEASSYRRALQEAKHCRACGDWSKVKICIGVSGLAPQRAYISKAYPVGTHIISLDDDIGELKLAYRYAGEKK